MKRHPPRKPVGKHPIPRFRSLEEESNFWDTHSPLDYGTWEEIPFEEFLREAGARTRRKVPVSFRIEPELLANLKRAARRYRMPYQTFMREVLWRTVRRMAQ